MVEAGCKAEGDRHCFFSTFEDELALFVTLAERVSWLSLSGFWFPEGVCFLLALGGLSSPSRQQKCLHLELIVQSAWFLFRVEDVFPYALLSLHLWLHAHLPFSRRIASFGSMENWGPSLGAFSLVIAWYLCVDDEFSISRPVQSANWSMLLS